MDIALWRRGPQDLPASPFLLALLTATYAGVSFVQVRLFGWSFLSTAVLVVIDVAMMSGWVWVLLSFFRKKPRYFQTLSAIFGVSTLLGILDALVRLLLDVMGAGSGPSLWDLAQLGLMAAIVGRILMLAIEGSLFTGVALALAIVFSTSAVTQLFIHSPAS
jgi:hypothetical protein